MPVDQEVFLFAARVGDHGGRIFVPEESQDSPLVLVQRLHRS